MKITILYIVSSLEACGPTRQLFSIIKHLDPETYEASVLTLSPEGKNSLLAQFEEAGVRVTGLGLSRSRFFLSGKRRLQTRIEEEAPDIVHTQGIRADTAVVSLKKRAFQHCMTLRNFAWEDYPDRYGNLMGKVMSIKHLRGIRACSCVVCCSYSLKRKYEQWFKGEKQFFCIQNGTDVSKCLPSCRPGPGPIYIMSGLLIERKSPQTVLEAFCRLDEQACASLWVLGHGPLNDACRRYESGRIRFFGNVADVFPYLAQADYLVSASVSEGLPNAVLEAGVQGLGLILSDIPQHREAVAGLEEGVFFFPVHGTRELEHCLKESLRHAGSLKHDRISEHFITKFSSESMSRQYQELYKRLAGRGCEQQSL